MADLRCVFCREPIDAASCVWVQLTDGNDFVCCPTVCAPMRAAVEQHRQKIAGARQLGLPCLDAVEHLAAS